MQALLSNGFFPNRTLTLQSLYYLDGTQRIQRSLLQHYLSMMKQRSYSQSYSQLVWCSTSRTTTISARRQWSSLIALVYLPHIMRTTWHWQNVISVNTGPLIHACGMPSRVNSSGSAFSAITSTRCPETPHN